MSLQPSMSFETTLKFNSTIAILTKKENKGLLILLLLIKIYFYVN
jgi:hypothetical protein